MKNIALTVLMLALVLNLHSQESAAYKPEDITKNAVYFELGGNGLITSINYERKITRKPALFLHVGTGIYGFGRTYLTLPFGINYLVRIRKTGSYLDFGFGATYSKADVKLYIIVDNKDFNHVNTNYWNYVPSIGYRLVIKNGLMFRACLSPVINHNDAIPFFGLVFGKRF